MDRYKRMEEILTIIDILNADRELTTIRDITRFIKNSEDFEDKVITFNIVDCAIRHYRKCGLVSRKHKPYFKPFRYKLSNKGEEKLEWIESGEYLSYGWLYFFFKK